MNPSGRIAVVTGAAGGIGGALVRGLAAAGAATVIATDLAAEDVEALAAEQGPTVVGRRLDVTDEAATRVLVDDVERLHGPVDLWFANAGVAGGGDESEPDATWELQWRVNVMSHVYAARALLPGWLARGDGHLVTTASIAGLLTSVGDAQYSATKHAAVGFAEWLALTYADQGVKVSCICPGAVDTAMLRAGAGGDAAKASTIIGGGEVITPEVAAARVLAAVAEDRFLILTHPEMAAFVTGKAGDPDRWIRGMSRLWARARALLTDQSPA
jgi:NAD(P)-dependent dehydrogenase (short-subunit alcohol dehydrogenase family)